VAGLLSANLLTALKSHTGVSVGWVAAADLVLTPGAAPTTVRFADAEAASWSQGHFDGLIKDKGAGIGSRSVPLFGGDLQVGQTSIVLVDKNRFWAKLTRGPVSRLLPGSPVRIYLTSNALTSFSDAFLETNMVIKSWERRSDYEITLHLKPDTTLLERALPDLVLTEALYPFADPEVWGLFAPLAYGIYDSRPTHGKGMLPAYCVDRNEFRFFTTIGPIEITAVFKDGEPWTDYTVELVQRGGYDVTEIVFPNGLGENVLATDVSITYDAKGYKDNAGVVITNPASQKAHFLRNFVFGSPTGFTWHTGPWLTSCPMLNVAAGSGFLETYAYFKQRNLSGAAYLVASTQRLGVEVLNEWTTSWHVKTFLRNDGKLDIRLLDPARRRPTADTYWIRETDVRSFQPKNENGLARKVMVQYHLDPVANQYTKNIEIADPTVPGNQGAIAHQLAWGPVNEGDIILEESLPDAA
jgi:hypothetical protein